MDDSDSQMRLHRHTLDSEGAREREMEMLGVRDESTVEEMKKKVIAN